MRQVNIDSPMHKESSVKQSVHFVDIASKKENIEIFPNDKDKSERSNLYDTLGLVGFFTGTAGLCAMAVTSDAKRIMKMPVKTSRAAKFITLLGIATLAVCNYLGDKNKKNPNL